MNKKSKVISIRSENKNFKNLSETYVSIVIEDNIKYLCFSSLNEDCGKKYIRVDKINVVKNDDDETYWIETDIGNFLIKEVIVHKNIINKFTDLENGMSIELRNGEEYVYIDYQFYDNNFILTDIGFFKNDFAHYEDSTKDIVIVYNCFGEAIWTSDKIKKAI